MVRKVFSILTQVYTNKVITIFSFLTHCENVTPCYIFTLPFGIMVKKKFPVTFTTIFCLFSRSLQITNAFLYNDIWNLLHLVPHLENAKSHVWDRQMYEKKKSIVRKLLYYW